MNIPLILWINLDKDIDRRNSMINQLEKHNLKNIRIPGINGSDYALNLPKSDFNLEMPIEMAYIAKRNAIACLSSHLKAIKYYADNYKEIGNYCLIAEDDIDLDSINLWSKSFWEYLKIYENVDWGIIQLQMFSHKKTLNMFFKSFNINIPHKKRIYESPYYGGGMYLIKYNRALEIIKELNITDKPFIDRFIDDIDYFNKMHELDKLNTDHKSITDDRTYTLPLFFLHEKINSSISKHSGYNSFQEKNNLRIKNFMKPLL